MLHVLGAIAALGLSQATLTNQSPINSAGTSTVAITAPSYTATAAAGAAALTLTNSVCLAESYGVNCSNEWVLGQVNANHFILQGAGPLETNGTFNWNSIGGTGFEFGLSAGAAFGTNAIQIFKDTFATPILQLTPAGVLTVTDGTAGHQVTITPGANQSIAGGGGTLDLASTTAIGATSNGLAYFVKESCAMVAGTTCTFSDATVSSTTGYVNCSAAGNTTGIAFSKWAVSAGTVTITASASNSLTWECLVAN